METGGEIFGENKLPEWEIGDDELAKEVNVDGLNKRVEENLESLVDGWEHFMEKEKVVYKTELK